VRCMAEWGAGMGACAGGAPHHQAAHSAVGLEGVLKKQREGTGMEGEGVLDKQAGGLV
jgi:hypothetical protein